ncbi:MAG: hypothetical protein ACRDL6_08420 [Solirubrobacterales bacterium]
MIAVAVVVLSSLGGEEHEFSPAPTACLDGWNGDERALALGRHQYDAHGYNRVQVHTLSPDGAGPASGPSAICAVVFPSGALDPEPSAAAFVQLSGRWSPLIRLQPTERLAAYQSEAVSGYNAEIGEDGRITPL